MLKKQTVNEDKIQKSKVQAEQSKPQSKDRKMSRGEILKKVFGHLGKYRIFVVFSVFLAAVSVALTLYIPKLIGYAGYSEFCFRSEYVRVLRRLRSG